MNPKRADDIIRHVAVALDASMQNNQAVSIAAELALMLEAELVGIFVEDINLIRLAELPFAREIRPASKSLQSVDKQRMERELKSIARQQRLRLEQVARARGINCSFSIRRGSIHAELMDCVSQADVLTVNLSGQQTHHRLWQKAAGTQHRPELMNHQQAAPVSVIFSGIEKDNHTLSTAASLAARINRPLNVILYQDSRKSSDIQAAAAGLLKNFKLIVHYLDLGENSLAALVDTISRTHSEMLLVNSEILSVQDELTWKFFEKLPCPVLLVRDQGSGT